MNARYEFIDEEKACTINSGARKYTIVKMCEWMEVSTSGFYEWLNRPASATAKRRDHLKLLIEKAFTDSDGTYGYRRPHAQLARWNEHCTPELVRALMRALGLVACQPRPWRHNLEVAPMSRETIAGVSAELSGDRPVLTDELHRAITSSGHPPAPILTSVEWSWRGRSRPCSQSSSRATV